MIGGLRPANDAKVVKSFLLRGIKEADVRLRRARREHTGDEEALKADKEAAIQLALDYGIAVPKRYLPRERQQETNQPSSDRGRTK